MGWGALESRFDAHYSQPKYAKLLEKLSKFQLSLLRKASSKIFSGMTPLSGGEAYTTPEDGIPFIRSGDFLSDNSIDFSELIYLRKEVHEKQMRGSQLKKDDVLFAIVGATIGKVAVYAYERSANINQAVCSVRLKAGLNPDYVKAFFQTSIGQMLIDRAKRPVARANINLDEIGQLIFPLVDILRQDQIVKILRDAYKARRNRIQEAVDLFSSIDSFLLSELGINLPTEIENNIENRIFTTRRRELAGFRFDPLFHSFKLWHAIEDAHVPCKKLGILCHYIKTGFAAGGNMQLFDDDGVIQLRPTNINPDREWIFDRNIYLSEALLKERPSDVVKPGEVLFNNTNSQELVGKTAYMDIEGQPFFCSNHMTRIATLETELNPEYLASVLNAYQRLKVFFSLCTNWNNQSGINVDLLHQLPIPVPDIHAQERIAAHIRDVRQEAKLLRQQAEAELNQAKQKIEAMLLGESV